MSGDLLRFANDPGHIGRLELEHRGDGRGAVARIRIFKDRHVPHVEEAFIDRQGLDGGRHFAIPLSCARRRGRGLFDKLQDALSRFTARLTPITQLKDEFRVTDRFSAEAGWRHPAAFEEALHALEKCVCLGHINRNRNPIDRIGQFLLVTNFARANDAAWPN